MLGTALTVGMLGAGALAANAAPQEFGHRVSGGFERGPDHGYGRGYGRGFDRGYERPVVRGYGYGGYGVAVEAPYVQAYIPPCPGEGYFWLNGAWVFRGREEVVRSYGYGRGFDHGHDRGFERGFDRGERGFDRGRGFEGERRFESGRR